MKPSAAAQATLLVDGYNIVGASLMLQSIRDRRGLAEARRELVEHLVNYSAFQGFDTQVVFDAQYQNAASVCEEVTPHLSVCFTDFGQTADTYIEKACAGFRHTLQRFQRRLIVATSDRAQQLTVVGYGAEWMSAQQLLQEVEFTAQRVRHQQRSAKRPTKRFLAHCLDPAAQERLAKLRLGLKPDS